MIKIFKCTFFSVILVLLSSCGTSNNFFRQKFTDLKKIKTESKNEIVDEEVGNQLVSKLIDESGFEGSANSDTFQKTESVTIDEVVVAEEAIDLTSFEKRIPVLNETKVKEIEHVALDDDDKRKREINWALAIYLFFFLIALGFLITATVLFFNWIIGGFILAALGPAAIFATIAAGLFLLLWLLPAFGLGDFGFLGGLAFYGLYPSVAIPIVYFLIWLIY